MNYLGPGDIFFVVNLWCKNMRNLNNYRDSFLDWNRHWNTHLHQRGLNHDTPTKTGKLINYNLIRNIVM